mmetsp:Transcript_17562/g.35053  ORF Transcript_17562/g.35053 Transcript_17562/m.35053 type:complete len:433 (+) Transcript_17562:35-1333(+)
MTEPKRYVRLNPRFERGETLSLLKTEIAQQQSTTDGNGDQNKYPLPVKWLRPTNGQFEFYAIPGDFSLNRSTSFQSGRVYGMDVTSGAAVLALLFDTYDCNTSVKPADGDESTRDDEVHQLRVLDLCCAPGLKLCMLADLAPPSSTAVGVDISQNRIQLCKNIIKKYHVNQMTSGPKVDVSNDNQASSSHSTIRLYCTDGTNFGTKQLSGLVFDSNAEKQELQTQGKRKRQNKSARAREKRRLLELQRQEVTVAAEGTNVEPENEKSGETAPNQSIETNTTCCIPLFDRVLVDAECSTDGAIKHIQKREASSKAPLWNDSNMSELVDLQKRLIESGFRLLKSGGSLVYSTCSLNEKQNENVVRWLLDKYDDAFIIPVSFNKQNNAERSPSFVEEGSLAGTIRFNPLTNADDGIEEECLPGTGFFLSKIGKRL